MSVTRRGFVREMVVASVGGAFVMAVGACGRRREQGAPLPPPPGELAFLSPAEFLVVAAASERILPRDQDPGAIDLGVPIYIDRALALDDFPDWGAPFHEALARLDGEAAQRFGKGFAEAPPADQDRLLLSWQLDGDEAQQTFFGRLMFLTIEGAFCNPGHGGNRDGAGWKMLAFQP